MPDTKLSTVWQIKDYAATTAELTCHDDECDFQSDDLTSLRHTRRPGLAWTAELYTLSRDEKYCKKGFASICLFADFKEIAASEAKCVLASFSATVLGRDDQTEIANYESGTCEFTQSNGIGDIDAFKIDDLERAVRKDGSLHIRIDLTVLNTDDVLKCRQLLHDVLADNTTVQFKLGNEGKIFTLHKAVLAASSPVLADLCERAEGDDVIELPDTNEVAFRAFASAIYYQCFDFCNDTDITQDVFSLAEKFKVDDLKRFCDDALSDKVNETNALEILARSAGPSFSDEKTKAACIKILADHSEFKESQIWLDLKEQNPEVAVHLLDALSDKLIASNRTLKQQYDDTKLDFGRTLEEIKQILVRMQIEFKLQSEEEDLLQPQAPIGGMLNFTSLQRLASDVESQLRNKFDDDSAVEWGLRMENARLEVKSADFRHRIEELQQQNAQANSELGDEKTIVRLRDEALKHLEEIRADLTELVKELQQNAEENNKLASLKEECPVCMDPYSAERPKECLVRCGHCFCKICVDRVKNEATSRRTGLAAVEFKCPICKDEFVDVVRPFNN